VLEHHAANAMPGLKLRSGEGATTCHLELFPYHITIL
jgi:hypothetical protein